MNIPRDHHYLPQAYLERWTSEGQLFRYVRPRGPDGPVSCLRRYPAAVAYERDLYRLRTLEDPRESQQLEQKFFQVIDDRAMKALRKLDRLERGSAVDRIALSQFMISLMHRSPSRLLAMRAELTARLADSPEVVRSDPRFEDAVSTSANRLLASLVGSAEGAAIVSKFKVFRIPIQGTRAKLLTSDRPILVSSELITREAFMILPYAPDRLVILCHEEQIPRSFATQNPDALVAGINQAVVEQSEDVIIAADRSQDAMIEKLFRRPQLDLQLDGLGLVRRKAPFVDLRPQPRRFSRHDKKGMLYLGRQ